MKTTKTVQVATQLLKRDEAEGKGALLTVLTRSWRSMLFIFSTTDQNHRLNRWTRSLLSPETWVTWSADNPDTAGVPFGTLLCTHLLHTYWLKGSLTIALAAFPRTFCAEGTSQVLLCEVWAKWLNLSQFMTWSGSQPLFIWHNQVVCHCVYDMIR